MEKRHVLIVDDNPDILTMLDKMLTFKGFEVSTLQNAQNLINIIEEIGPDIILMDMLLSGADGREVCANIKKVEELRNIPIVLFSAASDARGSCMASGADAFISKPFEMNHLVDTLRATVARAE